MQGTASVLRRLDAIKSQVEKLPNEIGEHAKRYASEAQEDYHNAYYVGANDVTVASDQTGKTSTITASGSALLFIEYGTGINIPGVKYPAEWSGSHAKFLTDSKKLALFKGWWPLPSDVFGETGVMTEGNPPANVMYETGKRVKEDIPDISKRFIDRAFT